MMKKQSIPWVLTTSKSIEEIATTVLQAIKSEKTILG
jgi:regulator of PEP synthase PpsR (kinase-PPPase family)